MCLLIGLDRRCQVKKISQNIFPYNCIGRIKGTSKGNKGEVRGSGFLISNCFALVSAHNFFLDSEDTKLNNERTFTFSIDGSEKQINISDLRINPIYKDIKNKINQFRTILQNSLDKQQKTMIKQKLAQIYQQQYQYDFALIKIEEKIERAQYFQLLPDLNPSLKLQLTVTGYLPHQMYDILLTHSGNISEMTEGAIFYDIDTTGGQDGSPVYIESDKNKVVAIHKGYCTKNNLNFGTKITTKVVILLQKWQHEMTSLFNAAKGGEKI